MECCQKCLKEEIKDKIREYLNTPIQLRGCITSSTKQSDPVLRSLQPPPSPLPLPPPSTIQLLELDKIPLNAAAQRLAINKKKEFEKSLAELKNMFEITTNPEYLKDFASRIASVETSIKDQATRLDQLKWHAISQRKLQEKKRKLLEKEQLVIKYDTPGHPPLIYQYPDIHDHIHACIEFGEANAQRRCEIIKVRTIKHLQNALEEKYNEYLSRTSMRNYILPRNNRNLSARAHHHPALVRIAGVNRDEKKDHIDSHYCLASVKNVRHFATTFADWVVMISQDDKAKVAVGIPAVRRHFETMQTVLESVSLPDHDFPIGTSQKLIPSVYLLINPKEADESLRAGQMAIFIRAQWHLGFSSTTHMTDILSLVSNEEFTEFFNYKGKVKPLWILLVDGGPDENPRHLKNVNQYCKLFRHLNLDYLTIRTHAPGQSAYNPVERSMATLSKKVAGITLPIDNFGNHLNSQGKVRDHELGLQNFRYAGEKLADLWRRVGVQTF